MSTYIVKSFKLLKDECERNGVSAGRIGMNVALLLSWPNSFAERNHELVTDVLISQVI